MFVKMTKTTKGSIDGTKTESFEEGETYEVSADLGNCFIADKVAEKGSAPKNEVKDEPEKSQPKTSTKMTLPGA